MTDLTKADSHTCFHLARGRAAERQAPSLPSRETPTMSKCFIEMNRPTMRRDAIEELRLPALFAALVVTLIVVSVKSWPMLVALISATVVVLV